MSDQAFDPDAQLPKLVAEELQQSWFASAVKNIKEFINPPKIAPLEVTSQPVEVRLAEEEPWFRSFIRNIRDAINPPKLPPLEVTSKPVAVEGIFVTYGKGETTKSGAISLLIHVAVIGLLFVIFRNTPIVKKAQEVATLIYNPPAYQPQTPPKKLVAQGGGGGGQKAPMPVSKGVAPPSAPTKNFIAPMQVTKPDPKLAVQPTLLDAPAPKIQADQYGDPRSLNPVLSGGQGVGGLGSGTGGGLGSGKGQGYGPGEGGGTGGGVYRIGGGVSAPAILSKVEPEYSEEARKAKYQGTVVLRIIVDEKGIPKSLVVIRPLGLGLDEKAIQAVQQWRFRPGMKEGRPVAVEATVEVNFRLL